MVRVVFMGSGEIGLPALEWLASRENVSLVGVFTQPDRPSGRGLEVRASAIKLCAQRHLIAVFQPEKLRATAAWEQLSALAPDLIIVAAYGQILSQAVLDLPRLGCLNLHASLLPRHRGASPIHAAILAGDSETGMTLMAMDAGLDTGDILAMERTAILDTDTAGSLHDRLAEVGRSLLEKSWVDIEAGILPRIPQDNSQATYAPKLEKSDAILDWAQPAGKVALRVRGLTPWPGAVTTMRISGQDRISRLKVLRATPETETGVIPGSVISANPEGILIACGSGSLRVREMQLEGRKRLPAADFLRGVKVMPGDRWGI